MIIGNIVKRLRKAEFQELETYMISGPNDIVKDARWPVSSSLGKEAADLIESQSEFVAAAETEIERLNAKLAEFKADRSYVIGFNAGWDEHEEQSKDGDISRIIAANAKSETELDTYEKANEARNAALEEAAQLIEGGFDRVLKTQYGNICAHGKYKWEDCDRCCAAAIRSLKRDK
jgi:hypothetical protein